MKFQNKIILIILSLILFQSSVDSNLWTKLINKTSVWSKAFSQDLKSKFHLISETNKVSIACNISIWQTLNGIENLEVWAMEMINSWGTFPPNGILIGTSTDFGSYDQCLDIQPNLIIERSQYCLIDLKPPLPKPIPVHHNLHHKVDVLPIGFKNDDKSPENSIEKYSEFASFFYWVSLRTGICTPSKCTEEDISTLAEGFAHNYGLEFKQSRCETKQTNIALNSIQIIAILFICTVLLISLTATLWERFGYTTQNRSETPLLIELFSLKQNLKCLFAKRSSEVFPCIHGIRVLTLVWVIFSHSTEWTNFQLFSRAFRVKNIFTRIESQLTLNGEYAVENFFFIGGMLTSFMTFQYTRGQLSRFSAVGFLLARFLRLTPQLFIFILLTFLLPVLGEWASGPIWSETINPIIENCSHNWWWNVFYIQNFFKATSICALHSWYLACDMQYHWISLLIVVPLLYKSKLGLLITCFSIMAFYLTSIIISYSYDLPPGLINTGRDQYFMDYYIDLFYIKPWSHSTVFFTGFLFGIIAYNKKFKKLSKISKYSVLLFIIIGYTTCLMDTYYWNTGRPHNRLLSAFIFSTSRILWSVSTAALIWLCISGNGGQINRYLSAKLFIPLSRLTYSVYLTHVWIIWLFVGSRRERIDTEWTEIVYIFIHNLIISYIIGFLFALIFEVPVIKLQKRLLKRFIDTIEESEPVSELRIKLNEKRVLNIDPNLQID